MRAFWFGWTAVAAALVGSLPAAAQAQTAAASPPNTASEVIVRARRVEENQQTVPVAVTAITDERLRSDTVTQIEDLQHNAPSLEIDPGSVGGSADPRFTIRGLSGELVTDPSVVTYFDEVPTDPRNIAYGLYDLDAVEVLRGPQGTLFGKNSTGGAVLLDPARPGPSFGGWLDARYGAFNDRELTGVLNAPLGPALSLRIAGEVERRDGTVKSVTSALRYDDRNHESVRAQLLYKPGGGFENRLEATLYRVRQINDLPILTQVAPCTVSAGGLSPICLFSSVTGILPFLPPFIPTNLATGAPDIAALLAQQRSLGRDKTVNAFRAPFDVDYDAGTDIASLTAGAVTVKNIAHLDFARYRTGFDFTGTGSGLLDQQSLQSAHDWSDEFQVLGKAFADRLTWIAGAFTGHLAGGERDVFDLVGYPGNPLFGFPGNPVSPQTVSLSAPQSSTAVFGQTTVSLSGWVRGLSLTGGWRHTWDERAFTQQRLQPGNPLLGVPACALLGFPGVDPATCIEHLSTRFGASNYDASLNWQANASTLVYVASRRGYKSGGFNFAAADPNFIQYAPEFVTDIEAGLKADWRLGAMPVRTNAALYRAKYDNIQAQFILQSPSGLPEAVVVNQDPVTGQKNRATLEGGEAELTVLPLRQLSVDANFGYAQGRYDQFTSEQSVGGVTIPISLRGAQIAGIVHTTVGVGLQYSPDTPAAWGRPIFSANLYSRSRQSANILNPTLIGGFTNLDLRLDWRDVGGRPFDIALYGTNITNSRHVTIANDLTSVVGIASAQVAEPAMYGVELRYHFGAYR
jgi:iron complex outermembrane receptor protein